MRTQHLHAAVPPLGGDFSPDLDRIFQRALAKTPDARHRTAQELASELRAAWMATERELLRSLARQWEARAQAPELLLGGDVLAGVERWTRQAPPGLLSKLECSYVATSQRRARRTRWLRSMLGAVAIMSVFGVLLMRARMAERQAELQTRLAQEQTRAAKQVTEATITQSELEQGRAALLHGEPEAAIHLGLAYKRGDRSPSTAFMFARALQPRLAELARFTIPSGRMWSAVFSPDGRQIATTDDRGARVWNGQTYGLVFELPHGKEVYQALYSADSARLITVAEDAVRIWDARSGALVNTLIQKRSDRKPLDYFVGAISFDGRLVSAMDATGSVAHVWDAISGAPLAELHSDPVEFPGLAFSADGHWLAATGG